MVETRLRGPPVTVIKPTTGWISLGFRDLWAYRELFYFLAWRDIKVRYKQTVIGVLWAVLQPVLTMIVFTPDLRAGGRPVVGRLPVPDLRLLCPAAVAALLHRLTQSSTSIVANQQLVTKVYFPRLIIPIAATISSVVDFLMSFVVLIGLMAYYDIAPPVWVFTLPLFLVLALATALGRRALADAR